MAVEIIATIVSVIKELVGLKIEFEAASRDRQDRIADFLIQISECLSRVIDDLAAGRVPHGSCAELTSYAARLPEILTGVIPDAENRRLSSELASAHDVESVAIELQRKGKQSLQTQLHQLDEYCGSLRGVGNSLRAMSTSHG